MYGVNHFSKKRNDHEMSWIREVEERLHWANVINIISINPAGMKAVNDLNDAIAFGAFTLSRTQEEAITTAVPVQNVRRFVSRRPACYVPSDRECGWCDVISDDCSEHIAPEVASSISAPP